MSFEVEVKTDLVYVESEENVQTADLYLPKGNGPFPALVLIHGGGYQAGSKEMYREWGPYLAESGYVAMSINYRLSSPENASWPGVYEDARSSLNWLIEHAYENHIDVARIGVIGDSAGGHLSTLLTLTDERIKVAIPVYGVYDLPKVWDYTQHSRADNPIGNLFGGSPRDCPEAYESASPLEILRKRVANGNLVQQPFLVILGDRDVVAPPVESEKLAACLRVAGAHVETIEIVGAGHFFFTLVPGVPGGGIEDEPNRTIRPKLIHFLKEYL